MRSKIKKHNQSVWREIRNPNHAFSHQGTNEGTVVVVLESAENHGGSKARPASSEMGGRPDNRSDAQFGMPETSTSLDQMSIVDAPIRNVVNQKPYSDFVISRRVFPCKTSVGDMICLTASATGVTSFGPLYGGTGELCH